MEPENVTGYLYGIIDKTLGELQASHCIEIDEVDLFFKFIYEYFYFQDGRTVRPLSLGRMASYYYVKHQTVKLFATELRHDADIPELLNVLTV